MIKTNPLPHTKHTTPFVDSKFDEDGWDHLDEPDYDPEDWDEYDPDCNCDMCNLERQRRECG